MTPGACPTRMCHGLAMSFRCDSHTVNLRLLLQACTSHDDVQKLNRGHPPLSGSAADTASFCCTLANVDCQLGEHRYIWRASQHHTMSGLLPQSYNHERWPPSCGWQISRGCSTSCLHLHSCIRSAAGKAVLSGLMLLLTCTW